MLSLCRPAPASQSINTHSDNTIEAGAMPYIIAQNSSASVVEPSTATTFIAGRDVSMRAVLQPSEKPYLLVPRIAPFSADVGGPSVAPGDAVPFVLSMLSSGPCGRADDPSCSLRVKFRRLDGASSVFRMPTAGGGGAEDSAAPPAGLVGGRGEGQRAVVFGYDDVCTPVIHAEYQHVDPSLGRFTVQELRATSID